MYDASRTDVFILRYVVPKALCHHLLGEKTITFFGSIVLTVNNVSGPGMLALPIVFQQAGWLMPTVVSSIGCF